MLAAERHEAVYDFGGFDPKLGTLRYDAPGDPALAARVLGLLRGAGIDAQSVPAGRPRPWRMDGARLHLSRSRRSGRSARLRAEPAACAAVRARRGARSAPPPKACSFSAAAAFTHNLRRVFASGNLHPDKLQPERAESAAFREWIAERAAARDWSALLAYRSLAPHAVDMHPSDEHLLPWYVAAGAGGREAAPVRLHAGATMGSLGMDAYAFGPTAALLRDAIASHGVA